MSIRITAVHLSGGTVHQHITDLWWTNEATGATGQSARADLVQWIEPGGVAYVKDDADNVARVGVVTPETGPKYVRTYADGTWTDNLLALPRR